MPAAVAALDLEATIAQALAEHRPELEQLVRERVQAALDELTRELVAAELNGHSNGVGVSGSEVVPASTSGSPESKRCSACRELLPLDRFPVDSRRRDGLRSRCRTCEAKRQRELRQRHRAEPEEAKPVPFAGTQSPTSHENTAAASSGAFSPTRSNSEGSSQTETTERV